MRAEEGIATNVLADRLARLQDDGVIVKVRSGPRRFWRVAAVVAAVVVALAAPLALILCG